MDRRQLLLRYPRIAAALLSVSMDTDINWAAGVLRSVKEKKSLMSLMLVKEAFKKRHEYKSKEAASAVSSVLSGSRFAA